MLRHYNFFFISSSSSSSLWQEQRPESKHLMLVIFYFCRIHCPIRLFIRTVHSFAITRLLARRLIHSTIPSVVTAKYIFFNRFICLFGIFGILEWPIKKNSGRLTHIIVLSEWDVRLAWIWVTAKRMRFTCRTTTQQKPSQSQQEEKEEERKKRNTRQRECRVSKLFICFALRFARRSSYSSFFSGAFAAFPHSVFIMKQAFFYIYIFHSFIRSFGWCCSGLMVYAIRVR